MLFDGGQWDEHLNLYFKHIVEAEQEFLKSSPSGCLFINYLII